MKDSCVVDSSVLIRVLLENNVEILKKLKNYRIFVPVNVLEESFFKIIIQICSDILKTEKFFKIKKFYSENSQKIEDIKSKLDALKLIRKNVKVLEINEVIFDLAIEISLTYGLLPNDALIAATCKFYNITKIATFDDDFEKVDFLEIVKV